MTWRADAIVLIDSAYVREVTPFALGFHFENYFMSFDDQTKT